MDHESQLQKSASFESAIDMTLVVLSPPLYTVFPVSTIRQRDYQDKGDGSERERETVRETVCECVCV